MKRISGVNFTVIICLLIFLSSSYISAQFIDNFNDKSIILDTTGVNGWTFYTGDGLAEMNFSQGGEGFSSINVDATKDKQNIWWALIRHFISGNMEISL